MVDAVRAIMQSTRKEMENWRELKLQIFILFTLWGSQSLAAAWMFAPPPPIHSQAGEMENYRNIGEKHAHNTLRCEWCKTRNGNFLIDLMVVYWIYRCLREAITFAGAELWAAWLGTGHTLSLTLTRTHIQNQEYTWRSGILCAKHFFPQ